MSKNLFTAVAPKSRLARAGASHPASVEILESRIAPAVVSGPWGTALNFGGTGQEIATGVAVDGGGNIYTVGYFSGTAADFDPGAGVTSFTSFSGSTDIFVTKMSPAGDLLWARQFGGTGSDLGQGIAVDGSGNVVVTGYFSSTGASFGEAGTLSTTGNNDGFLMKLDASGTVLAAAKFGGTSGEIARELALDSAGNVFVTGFFSGSTTIGATTLTSPSNTNAFVARFDANLQPVWARQLGDGAHAQGTEVAVDGAGNVYSVGYFSGSGDFDPGVGVSPLANIGEGYGRYLSKLDGSGNFVWARAVMAGGDGYTQGGLAVDAAGNAYISSLMHGTGDIDPSAGVQTVGGSSYAMAVSKLDAAGNLVWGKAFTSTNYIYFDDANGNLALDGAGKVYVTGRFGGTSDLGSGGAASFTSSNASGFVTQFDAATGAHTGAEVFAQPIAIPTGMTAGNGSAYVAGYFGGTTDFDPTAGVANLTSAGGGNDAFVAKLVFMEPVETTVAVDGSGNLVITDGNGGNSDDNWTLSLVTVAGTDYIRFFDGTSTVDTPVSAVTGQLQVHGLGGNDTLTIDLSSGAIGQTILFNGGVGGYDSIFLTGGDSDLATYNYTNANDGSILLTGGATGAVTIHYTGLEPISNDGTATNVIFNLPAGFDQVVLEDDGDGVGNSLLQLRSATASFETTVFANPSGTVTINTGGGLDTLVVNAITDLTAAVTFGSAGAPFSLATLNANISGAVSGAANSVTVNAAASIQDGINLAVAGATVNVGAGTFNENIVIDRRITLDGAGSGTGAGSTIIDGSVGGIPSSAVTIAAGGTSALDRVVVRDLHVQGTQTSSFDFNTSVSHVTLLNVSADGTEGSAAGYRRGVWVPGTTQLTDLVLDDVALSGFFGGGIYLDTGAKVDGFTLVNSTLSNNRLAFHNNANPAITNNETLLTNVLIADNYLFNNAWKGFYFEALSNAVIERNVIEDTGLGGPSPAVLFSNGNGNTGLELNLKYGNHSGISILNNVFDNSGVQTGVGNYVGGALAIKPRNDAASYHTNPAALDNVLVSGNVFQNIPANGRAILIGELGKNTATPTNLVITNNVLSNGTATAVVNSTANPVNASGNWWGTTSEAGVQGLTSGGVDFSPFLASGADTNAAPGFQGDFGNLIVTTLGAQLGAATRLQEAINLATGPGQITLLGGTFTGGATTTKNISLSGQGPTGTFIDGGASPGLTIDLPATNISLANLAIAGDPTALVNNAGATIVSTNVVLTDTVAGTSTVYGSAGNDTFELRNLGGGVEVRTNGGSWSAIPGGNTLVIEGLDGSDTLTVDLSVSNAIPAGGLTFNGGNLGFDSLVISGGIQGTVTYNYTNANDGSIEMSNFGVVTYTGLEPITNDGTATDIIFNLPATTNHVTLADDGLSGNSLSTLSSTPGTFELTNFLNPTGSLTINRGSANDTLTVNGLPDFDASLTVGSAANPFATVNFTGALTLASDKSLAANASGAINLSTANSDLVTFGTGAISLTAGRNIAIASGAVVSVVDGTLTLSANAAGTGAGNFVGIRLLGSLQSTGSGAISLSGTGGNAGTSNFGIQLGNGSAGTISSTGTGTVTLDGRGGAGVGGDNDGIIMLSTSSITSGGDITLTGTIGTINGLNQNEGLNFDGGNSITATGSANITLITDTGFLIRTAAISAAGDRVTLKPKTAGTPINLGTYTNLTAGIPDNFLDSITAGVVQIGDSSSGSITISAPINPGGTSTLSLVTGGGVTQSTSTTRISVANLAMSAGGAIAMNLGSGSGNFVGTLAATGASVSFNDANGLVIGTVDGISGVNAMSSFVSLRLDAGPLTVNNAAVGPDVSGAGVFISLWGDDTLFALASGASIVSTGTDLTVHAGKMDIQGTMSSAGTFNLYGSNNDAINLGSATDAAVNTLELSDAELDRISAASLITIGSGSLTADITLSADMTQGSKQLRLMTNGSVNFSGGSLSTTNDVTILADITADGSGTDLTANRLIAVGTVGSAANPLRTELARISVQGASSIYVVEASTIELSNSGLIASGPISLETVSGSINLNSGQVSGGAVSLTAGGAGSNIFVPNTSGTSITLTADNMTMVNPVNAGGGTVILKPFTPGREIDLGVGNAARLSLSDAELDQITAGTIQIGDTSSGAVTITANITRPASTNVVITTGANNNIALGSFSLDAGAAGNISLTTSGMGAITVGDNLGNDLIGNAITLSAGSGGIGGVNALRLSGSIVVASTTGNAGINLAEADTIQITGAGLDAGTGQVNLTSGDFVLAAPLTASQISINGTLALGGTGFIPDATGVHLDGAGVFDLNGFSETIGRLQTLASTTEVKLGGATLTVINTQISHYLGTITGTGGLVLQGTGEILISGDNSYGGATLVNGPLVALYHPNALGSTSGATTVDAGTVLLGGTGQTFNEPLILTGPAGRGFGALENYGLGNTWAGPITLTASSSIGTTFNGNNLTVTGAISGVGGLTIQGQPGAKVTLAGTNTYGGTTVINAGTILQIGNGGITGTLGGGGVTDNGTLIFDRTDTLTVSNVISGSGTLLQAGAGTLNLTGANTYTGATNITAGILRVNGSITSNVTVTAPGTLGGSGTIAGNVSGNGTVAAGNSPGVLTISGDFTPTGTVEFEVNSPYNTAGTDYDQIVVGGNVDLSGATLTFAGGVAAPAPQQLLTLISKTPVGSTVASSSPAEGGTVTLGSAVFTIFYNGGDGNDVVLVDASTPTVVYVEDTAWSGLTNGTIIADADFGTAGNQPAIYGVNAFSNITAGIGAVTASGDVVVNAGTYAEAVSLNGTKTLIVTTGAAVTTNSFASIAGTTLEINGTGFTTGNAASTTVAGVITGGGNLTKQGAGTLTLMGANSFDGEVLVNAGVLNIRHNTALGSTAGGTTVAAGATLQLQGGIAIGAEALSLPSNALASGIFPLVNVNGDNSWAGAIAANTTTTVTRLVSLAGTLTLSGNITTAGTGQLVVQGDGNGHISGDISGDAALTKSTTGTGTWILSGANSYTGTTTISNGTLQIGNGGTTGTLGTAGASIGGSGTLAFLRSDSFTVPNTISGAGTLSVLNSGGITFTSTVSPSQVNLVNTTGTIAFDSSVTATTLTTANQNYSVAFNGNTSVTNAVTFLNTGNVALGNGGDTLNFAGGVTTSGNASNPALTTLAGNLASTNALIRLGTLQLAGNSTAASGTAALTFSGTVDGAFALSVNSTGATTFSSTVGGTAALASLATNAGGTTTLFGNVTTTGGQTYGDNVTLGATVSLASAGGGTIAFGGTINGTTANTQSLTINAGAGAITFGGAIGGGTPLANLTTNSGNSALVLPAATLGGNLSVTTNSGAVSQTGVLTIAGTTSLTLGVSSATLNNASNNFGGSVTILSGVNATLADINGIQFDNVSLTGNLAVTAGGAVSNVVTATINVGSNASFSAGAANIVLGTNGASDTVNFGSLTVNTTGSVAITENSATLLTGANTAGALVLNSTAAITDVAGTSLNVSGNASFDAPAITLGDNVADTTNFGSLTFNSAGAVSIQEDSSTQLLGTSTAASLSLSSASSITDAAAASVTVTGAAAFASAAQIVLADSIGDVLSIGGTATFNAAADIVVASAGTTNFGSLTFSGAAVNIFEDSATSLTGTSTADSLSLIANGDITNTASATLATISGAHFNAGSGAITLGNQSSDLMNFGTLTFTTTGAVTVLEDSGTQLSGTSTANTLALTANGAITNAASASVTVTGNASFSAGTNSITLGTAAGDTVNFETVTFTTSGAVTLSEDSGTNFAGTNTAGSLSATAAGQISQTGPIAVAGASTFAAGANSITLTHAGNDFTGPVALFNSGANAVAITDANAIIIAASNVGSSTLAVTAIGITQTGAVTQEAGAGTATFNGGAGAIVLTAANDFTGPVNASVTGANDITINDAAGNLRLGLITAPNRTVTLTSTGGQITDDGGGNNVNAQTLNISAISGIGISGGLGAIDTTVSFIKALTVTGGIGIDNTGALTITDTGAFATPGGARVTGASGGITIHAFSPLTVAADVTSPGAILLSAAEAIGAGDNLTVNNGVIVQSTGLSVTLQAGDNILLSGGVNPQVSAATTVTLTAANADADNIGGIAVNGGITAGGLVTLSARDAITLNANVTSTGGNLAYTSTAGAITRTAGTSAGNLLTASAAAGITLTTDVATLNLANTTTGNITVSEANAVAIALAVTQAGNGSITIANVGSSSDVTVTGLISAHGAGSIDLLAQDELFLGDTVAGDDVISGTGSISLRANAGVHFNDARVTTLGNGLIHADANLAANTGPITTGLNGLMTANDLVLWAAQGIALNTSVNTLAATNTFSGDITINETNGVALNQVSNPGRGIFITLAAGAITDNNGNAQNLIGDRARLVGPAGIGASGNLIETTLANFEAQSTANGIYIAETDALTIGGVTPANGVNATTGDVQITSGALLLAEDVTTTGAVTFTSTGTITETTGAVKTASLLTTSSAGGQLLNGANTVGSFAATNATAGNIDFNNAATTLAIVQITNPAGDTTVVNAGNVQLGTALNQNVNVAGIARITANGGAITDGNAAPGDNNITALAAILTASSGIGAANPIETNVANLEGDSGTGAFRVNEANALTVGGASLADDGIVAGGNVDITSGALSIVEQLISGGAVTLTSTGSIAESAAGRISAVNLATSSAGGQILNGANTVGTFTATNTGAGTGISLENTANGFVISTVTSQTGGDIYINNAGNGATVTGAITSGNPILGGDITISSGGTLTVNATVDSRGGSGGTLTISNLVVINTSPIVGFGDVTLQGGAGTLTINAPITVASGLTLTATDDVNILAKVETNSVLADLTVLADTDGDGAGGVYLGAGPGTNQGQLKSGRNLDVRGSEYMGSIVPALANLDNSIIITSNGSNARLEAVGNVLVKNNNAAPFDAQIWLGGLVRSNTNGDVAFDNAVLVTSNDARVHSHSDGNVIFLGTVDSDTAGMAPYDLRIAGGNGVVLFNDAVGAVNPLRDVTIESALDVTVTSTFSARSLTIVDATGTVEFGGAVTTTGNGTNLSVNAVTLLVNGAIDANAAGADLGNVFLQVNNLSVANTITGDGTLTIQPREADRSIGLNAAGDLNLDDSELDLIQGNTALEGGFIQILIGRVDGSGLISVGERAGADTWEDPVVFRSPNGGSIALLGQIEGSDDAGFTFLAPSLTVNVPATPTVVTAGGAVQIGSFLQNATTALQSDLEIQTSGGAVTIVGTINGAFGLSIDADAGAVYINGNTTAVPTGTSIGGTTALSSITVSGGLLTLRPNMRSLGAQTYTGTEIHLLGGDFRTFNDGAAPITFDGPVVLEHSIAIHTTNSAISFLDTVDNVALHTSTAGRGALRLTAEAGSVLFAGDVGTTFAPKTVEIVSAGLVEIGTSIVPVTFRGGVTVSITTEELDMFGDVAVPGGVLSITNLLDSQAIIVGGVELAGSLDISNDDVNALGNGTASIIIGRRAGSGTADLLITGAPVFNDPVVFQQPAKISGPILMSADLFGTDNGSFTFNGPATRLDGTITTAGGFVNIENAVATAALTTIDTSNGAVTFRGSLTGFLGGEDITVDAGTGTIHLNTVKSYLSATTMGTLTLVNDPDGLARIERGLTVGALIVQGGGTVNLKGTITTTEAGGQTYDNAVHLIGSTNLTSVNAAGAISFGSTIDSNPAQPTKQYSLNIKNRTLGASGILVEFDGAIGQGTLLGLGNLKVNTTGDVIFGPGADVKAKGVSLRGGALTIQDVSTTGAQVYNGAATFQGTINASKLNVTSTIDIENTGGAWNVTGRASLTAKNANIAVTGGANTFGELQLRGINAEVSEVGDMVIRSTSLKGVLDVSTTAGGDISNGAARISALRLEADAAGSLDFFRTDTRLSELGTLHAVDDINLHIRGVRYILTDGPITADNGDILLVANPLGRSGSFRTDGNVVNISAGGRWVVFSHYAEYPLDGTDLVAQLGADTVIGGQTHPYTVPATGNIFVFRQLRA